tara:strand:+ start:406 stop:1473 length:1068 start_codon:yes stop_codon:yes gene_type:complete
VTAVPASQLASSVPFAARVVADVVDAVGLAKRVVARMLGKAESTVRSWCSMVADAAGGFVRRVRGRPRRLASRLQRRDIVSAIHASAGKIGLRDLKGAYPDVGRAHLAKLLRRYRRVMRRRRRRGFAVLQWRHAGAAWAMDFTMIHGGVADRGPHVLVVRDLASGRSLAADPCDAQDAASTMVVLRRLFAEHGAPLVLKCDNGSGFVACNTKAMLLEHHVLPLYSPPGTPAYNGACEAGVGSVKHRAEALAYARGRCAGVALDDLDAALQQANQQPVERRANALSRDQEWSRRLPITRHARRELSARVAVWRRHARDEQGIAASANLPHAHGASIDRFAIARALHETRFLFTRRR